MTTARTDHTLVVLADGRVLAVGGRNAAGAYVHEAEWFDPLHPNDPWQSLAPSIEGHAYHSTAVLLPDAKVLVAGEGNDPVRGGEVFTPPYLLTGNPRPLLSSAPASALYGKPITIRLGDVAPPPVPANQIARVALVRFGAVTHGFDQNQRYVPLAFTVVNSTTLRATTPANVNEAPPGYYMLFVVAQPVGLQPGVPSMGRYFQLVGPSSI